MGLTVVVRINKDAQGGSSGVLELRLGLESRDHRLEPVAKPRVELCQLPRLCRLSVGLLGGFGPRRLDTNVVASDPEAYPALNQVAVRDDGNRAQDCVALSAVLLSPVRKSLEVVVHVLADELLKGGFSRG